MNKDEAFRLERLKGEAKLASALLALPEGRIFCGLCAAARRSYLLRLYGVYRGKSGAGAEKKVIWRCGCTFI